MGGQVTLAGLGFKASELHLPRVLARDVGITVAVYVGGVSVRWCGGRVVLVVRLFGGKGWPLSVHAREQQPGRF